MGNTPPTPPNNSAVICWDVIFTKIESLFTILKTVF